MCSLIFMRCRMPIDPEAEQKSFPQHYPFLDGIRGIAILWVFLFHSLGASYGWDHFPWNGLFRSFDEPRSLVVLFPLSLGGLGVAIFFAVSGFCIHLSHLRNREKGWTYFFYRRFFRIYPAYLVAILIFFFSLALASLFAAVCRLAAVSHFPPVWGS